jgi:hypothetical protein
MRFWATLTTAIMLGIVPAIASEDLVSGLSQDTVEITSNYTGTDIVVFGAIERPEDTGINDVVVIVRGPDTDMTVRVRGPSTSSRPATRSSATASASPASRRPRSSAITIQNRFVRR